VDFLQAGEMMRFPDLLLPILLASLTPRAAAADRDERNSDARSGALFETITRVDRHLTDAFNAHNVERLMAMATKDLELYEDNEGLKRYQQCYDDFKKMFVSDSDIRRQVIEGAVEVYPIKDYGALEIGQHRFCHAENGRDECAVFAFAILWQKTAEDTWKIARLINYRR
jgi:ketosteroid isomerase-like protein